MTAALPSPPAPSDRAPSAVQRRSRPVRHQHQASGRLRRGGLADCRRRRASPCSPSRPSSRRLQAGNRPADAGDASMPCGFQSFPATFRPRPRGSSAPEPWPTSGMRLASIEEKRVDLATVLGRIKSANGDSTALDDIRHPFAAAGRQSRRAWKRPSPNGLSCGHDIESLLDDTHRVHGRDHRPPRRNLRIAARRWRSRRGPISSSA